MPDRPYNVLFLCTGNSARSIIAEALINQWGRGKFKGFSAGSHPKGQVHPIALALLQRMNFPTEGFRSKSWDELPIREGPAVVGPLASAAPRASAAPARPANPPASAPRDRVRVSPRRRIVLVGAFPGTW